MEYFEDLAKHQMTQIIEKALNQKITSRIDVV